MLTAIGQILQTVFHGLDQLTAKEWVAAIGIVITTGTFWWKLKVDAAAARYRETIAYIDRHSTLLHELCDIVEGKSSAPTNSSIPATPVLAAKKLLNQLETAALLVKKRAFDGELVYNQWWRYFTAPMEVAEVKTWVAEQRKQDRAILEHFCALSAKWKIRVQKEQQAGH